MKYQTIDHGISAPPTHGSCYLGGPGASLTTVYRAHTIPNHDPGNDECTHQLLVVNDG